MTVDKRVGWLAKLKVGSEVLVSRDGYSASGRPSTELAIVSRLTPSGMICVGNYRYSDGGKRKVSDFTSYSLMEATPEALEELRIRKSHRGAINRVDSLLNLYQKKLLRRTGRSAPQLKPEIMKLGQVVRLLKELCDEA